jgi:hypothetical protein
VASGFVNASTAPMTRGKNFNLSLRYDAKVDQEAKVEAAKLFAAELQK